MDYVHRPDKPKREDLLKVYMVINQIIKADDCYYKENDERVKGKEKI